MPFDSQNFTSWVLSLWAQRFLFLAYTVLLSIRESSPQGEAGPRRHPSVRHLDIASKRNLKTELEVAPMLFTHQRDTGLRFIFVRAFNASCLGPCKWPDVVEFE
ncbi:hypothetical protein F4859DRAFT_515462 [Xylaria cf. heliscus]|nr:hypothetical protein F4859DRAFT_515462 [Xylaria cf. heliscus]